MSNLRLDSHKLIFHPKRVSEWLNGEEIYPISLEIGLSSICNHRCIFCAVDYAGYKPVLLDKEVILNTLKTLKEKGLKSVVISGEGEPFCNKDAVEIINRTKKIGLDIGVSSNGVLFDKSVSSQCLSSIDWIRFSIAAGTKETYSKIHQTKETDFDRVLKNISYAVSLKKELNLKTTIGIQLLLISDNAHEVMELGKISKEMGVDYYTVKPYSQHPDSINKLSNSLDYNRLLSLKEQLDKLETEHFKIYFREHAMKKLYQKREYPMCYGLDFFTHIDSNGNVIPCIRYLENQEYVLGNINQTDIIEIWENSKKIFDNIQKNGVQDCREICRLDEINKYLYELKNPSLHSNFI